MTNKPLDLSDYLRIILDRHPGLSDRQAAVQAGLANNAVTQIVNRAILRPRPSTLEALAETWGTPEDYRELMRLAGYRVPETLDLSNLSPAKRQIITLLSSERISDAVAAAIAAGLKKLIEQEKNDTPR
jgi:transcriptional regulator with XRE-family HTH domain